MSYQSDLNYYGDHRVAGAGRRWWKSLDDRRQVAVVTVTGSDADGDFEEDRDVAIKFDVCPTCRGKGNHVNPSVDCDGISAEDLYGDPDFASDYLAGVYDVPCYECHGARVVPVIDPERADAETVRLVNEQQQARADFRREQQQEREWAIEPGRK